jgi:glycosyltransferase involved in cell wall biosynthesis
VTANRRTRVLWLSKGLGRGGTERLLVEHAARGDRSTFEYEAAYLLPWKDLLVWELARHGVPAHCLGVRNELDIRWLSRLDHLVHKGRFDVVHVHSPSVAAAARLVLKARPRTRRPAVVYTEHNRWPSYKRATRVANHMTYRMNDATIAVSEDVRASIAPALRPRVRVVVHGVDTARVRPLRGERDAVRQELGIAPSDVLAVTVANLRVNKNYPGLLAAAKIVLDRQPAVRFVAAGQGPLAGDIGARRDVLGLGDGFRLLGYRDDATRLIAGADLFVLASDHEGLPVSVMEALVLGVPVVATAVGGLGEAVSDGHDGLLVAPGNAQALADAITRVATDTDLRCTLARNAERSGTRFSARVATATVEDVYRSVLQRVT